jgi:hypothetical protein
MGTVLLFFTGFSIRDLLNRVSRLPHAQIGAKCWCRNARRERRLTNRQSAERREAGSMSQRRSGRIAPARLILAKAAGE